MYVHSVYMAKKRDHVRGRRQYRRTFLREWRKHRGLTLEKVAEQVGQRLGRKFTHASLSRIERGLQPYSQGILEALADIYDTSVVALLIQSPNDSEGIWPIWEQASPSERKAIVEVSRALVKSGSKK
jgi:transcriptional regulator with XRE-family HTH domain